MTKWLNEELKTRGWSIRELARRAEISHTTIADVLSHQRQPTWDFCAAIATPLEKTPVEVFKLAGLLPDIPAFDEDSTFGEIHEALQPLTPEEREDVLLYILWRNEQRGKKKPPPAKPIPAALPKPAPVVERLAMEAAAMDIDPELKKKVISFVESLTIQQRASLLHYLLERASFLATVAARSSVPEFDR